MRIVYVPESFPQPSETFIINEIDGLLELGYQVSVVPRIIGDAGKVHHARLQKILRNIRVVTDNTGFDIKGFLLGLKYGGQVPIGWRPNALIRRVMHALRVATHVTKIKAQNPDLIMIHFGYDNAAAGVIAALLANVPAILWLHGSDMHTVPHRSLGWITGKVSVVVTNSMYSSSLLGDLGVKNRIEVSHLGVDIDGFQSLLNTEKENNPTIICTARLGHSKNHGRLLHVFKQVQGTIPNAQLWLVGDGPNRQQYESMVAALNLKQVVFWGSLPQEKVFELLKKAWIKVLLSDKEALGVALIEAQASGLPCVATSVGGIPEVVEDHETGCLFDLSSPDFDEKVALAIVNLLQDDDLRGEMGGRASRRAEKFFNEKSHIQRMDKLIKQLLKKQD
ncbi:MAG: glycosyltransferase family 4 protein [Candidatus Sedimenticola sp. (ex Thyasira tokunagai)]